LLFSRLKRSVRLGLASRKSELQMGNAAGREHYIEAGRMLNESKGKVPYGGWVRWLHKNFALARQTAAEYMRLARMADEYELSGEGRQVPSLNELRGGRERRLADRQSTQQQAFRKVLREVAREKFVQERQARQAYLAYRRARGSMVSAPAGNVAPNLTGHVLLGPDSHQRKCLVRPGAQATALLLTLRISRLLLRATKRSNWIDVMKGATQEPPLIAFNEGRPTATR
jgi:hypothetical protein